MIKTALLYFLVDLSINTITKVIASNLTEVNIGDNRLTIGNIYTTIGVKEGPFVIHYYLCSVYMIANGYVFFSTSPHCTKTGGNEKPMFTACGSYQKVHVSDIIFVVDEEKS